MNKYKRTIRNIFWIALVAVWSFLAGAYFNLGWVKDASMSYTQGFFLGGIAMWMVFIGMGIFVYRIVKKNEGADPAKSALLVVSFFTVCFLIIAWVKYDDVKRDKYMDDISEVFVLHYSDVAKEKQLVIEDLDFELELLFSYISYDLENDPKLEQLMAIKTEKELFEENKVISNLCQNALKSYNEKDSPFPKELKLLFE
ncbi:MAG: hypothetical protein IT221_00965 [Fluviicola sp.]|nr:hypothetical protein [Fluviicola sp.]